MGFNFFWNWPMWLICTEISQLFNEVDFGLISLRRLKRAPVESNSTIVTRFASWSDSGDLGPSLCVEFGKSFTSHFFHQGIVAPPWKWTVDGHVPDKSEHPSETSHRMDIERHGRTMGLDGRPECDIGTLEVSIPPICSTSEQDKFLNLCWPFRCGMSHSGEKWIAGITSHGVHAQIAFPLRNFILNLCQYKIPCSSSRYCHVDQSFFGDTSWCLWPWVLVQPVCGLADQSGLCPF